VVRRRPCLYSLHLLGERGRVISRRSAGRRLVRLQSLCLSLSDPAPRVQDADNPNARRLVGALLRGGGPVDGESGPLTVEAQLALETIAAIGVKYGIEMPAPIAQRSRE
jgi:hypothetical protein